MSTQTVLTIQAVKCNNRDVLSVRYEHKGKERLRIQKRKGDEESHSGEDPTYREHWRRLIP